MITTSALKVTVPPRPLPHRLRHRRRRVAGRGRPRARHRGAWARARGSGSACATTSTSTASARRTAASTSAAASWAATRYAMWNSDTFGYGDDTDPIYVSVPFFMVMRNGRAHGIFLDNTFRSTFDVGHESQEPALLRGRGAASSTTTSSTAPRRRQVVERYTTLTGRMPLPPRWALGFNQCRYSYYPESKVRFIADNFRAAPHPRGRDLARHPLPGRLQALHLGPGALPRSRAAHRATCARRASAS